MTDCFRFVFYVLNLAILVLTVTFFTIGFVKFEKYSTIYLGSFVGGWVTSVSTFYFCVGAIGIVGTRYNHIPLLGIYFGINVISFAVRILTVALFTIKKYGVHWSSYATGAAEVLMSMICLSILMVVIETGGLRNRQTTSKRETTSAVFSSSKKDRKSAGAAEEGSATASSSSAADKFNNF